MKETKKENFFTLITYVENNSYWIATIWNYPGIICHRPDMKIVDESKLWINDNFHINIKRQNVTSNFKKGKKKKEKNPTSTKTVLEKYNRGLKDDRKKKKEISR